MLFRVTTRLKQQKLPLFKDPFKRLILKKALKKINFQGIKPNG